MSLFNQNHSSFIKDRYSDELNLIRSNKEVLPVSAQELNLSTPKVEALLERSRSKAGQLSYQNLLTFSFEKENSKKLSFSNLKKSLKTPFDRTSCGVHPNKKATYRQADGNRVYCKQCAIQVASKGIKVHQVLRDSTDEDVSRIIDLCGNRIVEVEQILNREFGRAKATITAEIETINQYYTAIIQKVSEMQIKDLMVFETCLDSAEKQLRSATEQLEICNRDLETIPKSLAEQEVNMICNVINAKTDKLSNLKFQVVKQNSAFKSKMENITYNIQNLHLCLDSQKPRNTISQILKSNSTFSSEKLKGREEIRITESVQDTPQSLKKKLSVSGKSVIQFQQLKTIEFCQSITDLPSMLAVQTEPPRHRYQDEQSCDE